MVRPGEKGAPPGSAIIVGSATPSGRQIMEQFCRPRSRVFVDHFARSLFVFVGLVFPWGLPNFCQEGWLVSRPGPWGVFVGCGGNHGLVQALEFINTKHAAASLAARYSVGV